jgi:hypothetical protein
MQCGKEEKMGQHFVYRFYAELKDYTPKIWRRFEINGETTMAELGYAIMLMFEMHASHQFCFIEPRRDAVLAMLPSYCMNDEIKSYLLKHSLGVFDKDWRYELPSDDMYLGDLVEDESLILANRITLNRITDQPGWKLTFEYDDDWELDIVLENCEKREVSLAKLPRVLDGKGYGIVEDVGGTTGLSELAKVLKRGSGREYDEFCEWLGSTTLNLKAFDKDDMNFRLKKLMRVYKDIYEYRHPPTDRMLKVLNRKHLGKGLRGY